MTSGSAVRSGSRSSSQPMFTQIYQFTLAKLLALQKLWHRKGQRMKLTARQRSKGGAGRQPTGWPRADAPALMVITSRPKFIRRQIEFLGRLIEGVN